MTDRYAALAARVQGLEDALVEWIASVLARAEIDVDVRAGGSGSDTGLQLRPRRVSPEKPPDVGLDYGLMGSWGTERAEPGGPVPMEWLEVGHAIRRRFEALTVEQDESDEPLPPPRPLVLDRLPSALQHWYGSRSPAAGSDSFPDEPWLTDDGRARLPYLSWYPGFEVSLDYQVGLVGDPPVSTAATLAVLATAVRLERMLPTSLPSSDVSPDVSSLLEALDDGESMTAAADAPLQVSFTVEPAGPDEGPGLLLSLRLPVLRGVTVRPGSQLGWRTAAPKRRHPTPSWKPRDE